MTSRSAKFDWSDSPKVLVADIAAADDRESAVVRDPRLVVHAAIQSVAALSAFPKASASNPFAAVERVEDAHSDRFGCWVGDEKQCRVWRAHRRR